MSNICFIVRSSVPNVCLILLHEYRCLQCGRHEHSPYHRMFFAVLCCIYWGLFFFAFFVLDRSSCARMIWIITTILILFLRLQWRIDALLLEGKQRVSPFYHPSIHQVSTLENTNFLSNVPFWVAWWVFVYSGSALVTRVPANNGFSRSIVLLSLRTQRTLTFVSGLPRAFWCSRR